MSYYSKPLSADVGSIQIFCRIRLTENLRWINKWVMIEIINTNRNKEKVMRSLFLASTWLENVCYLAKEIINAKIVWKWKMLMFTTIFSYQRHMSRWQGTLYVYYRCALKNIDDIVIFACQLWPKYDFNADLYLLQRMNGGQIRFYLRIYCRTLGILWYMYK